MREIFGLNEKRIQQLLTEDVPISKLVQLEKAEFLLATWGIDGYALLYYIDSTKDEYKEMSFDTFLTKCTPCGGDWGQMFLTGIKELYPTIYNLIPDDMGLNPFASLYELLRVLGIEKCLEESGE